MTIEWPELPPRELPPEAVRVEIDATIRDGHPVAVLRLFDPIGDHRVIHVQRAAAWHIARGLLSFLEVADR